MLWCGLTRNFHQSALGKRVFLVGVPIVGGLIDSVVGILTGTVFGIAPQLAALLRSLGIPV